MKIFYSMHLILNNLRANKLLILLFSIGFLLKVSFGIFMFITYGTTGFNDDWDYISFAKNIIDQGVGVPDLSSFYSNSSEVGPAYPLIVALFILIFGENYLILIILNAIVCALIPVAIYMLAKLVFTKHIAVFSFIWSSLYVLHIRYVPRIIKEEFLFLLFPLIIYFIISESRKNKLTINFLMAPILYTVFIHMDERFFFYFPLFALSYIFLNRKFLVLGIKKAVYFSVTVLLLMVPWTIRNYSVYNKLAFLTIRTSIYTDKLFGYTNETDWVNHIYTDMKLNPSAIDSIKSGYRINYISIPSQKIIESGLKDGVYPHNYNLAEKWLNNFRAFFEPVRFSGYYSGSGYLYRGPWSLKHNLSEGITYGLLLPFFFIGSIFIFLRKNKYGLFLLAVVFLHAFLHIVLAYVVPRYRLPIDAFIIIIAFYGLSSFLNFCKINFRIK